MFLHDSMEVALKSVVGMSMVYPAQKTLERCKRCLYEILLNFSHVTLNKLRNNCLKMCK